jgi:hypothetical protein
MLTPGGSAGSASASSPSVYTEERGTSYVADVSPTAPCSPGCRRRAGGCPAARQCAAPHPTADARPPRSPAGQTPRPVRSRSGSRARPPGPVPGRRSGRPAAHPSYSGQPSWMNTARSCQQSAGRPSAAHRQRRDRDYASLRENGGRRPQAAVRGVRTAGAAVSSGGTPRSLESSIPPRPVAVRTPSWCTPRLPSPNACRRW